VITKKSKWLIAMNLMFDSIAVFDEKADAVKFAGRYVNGQGFERFIIAASPASFCLPAAISRRRLGSTYWNCIGRYEAR
jgi:hypothetical protein